MTDFNGTNRFSSTPQSPSADAGDAAFGPRDEKGPAAVERLLDDLSRLIDNASLYLAARQDQLKLGLRRAVVGALLGLLGLLAGGAILVTAAVLLLTGIASGLGELFGRPWLGQLATGLSVLALAALGVRISVSSVIRSSRWRTINRYAKRHKEQYEREQSRSNRVTPSDGAAKSDGARRPDGFAVGK
jgi:hypothetical protein